MGDVNYYYETYGEGMPIINLSGFAIDLSYIRDSFESVFESKLGYK